MMLDVRFLPNPYFEPALRPLTGEDAPVFDYVMGLPESQTFLQHTTHLLQFLVPQYQKEGKRYLTVAIGCTGGQHRSVSIARALEASLAKHNVIADLRHRDVGTHN